jgi:RsiW-degrading membrane proteinase PrsW (M82 family)
MTLSVLGYAFLGGILPSLIWLYFLLKEDASHHEPKKLLAIAFIAGMAAVPLAVPLEQLANATLIGSIPVLTTWALIEEVLKYGMAAAFILWRPIVDEAPEYVIYMITVALGFAATENMLFLITPILDGDIASSIFAGDTRFIGATLLHVFASALIGFALAFSHTSRPAIRVAAASGGLILAIALHTAFNALIITQGTSTTFAAVSLVWAAAVIFFATFEVLKFFQYRNPPSNSYKP